jgi:hypothetical protein
MPAPNDDPLSRDPSPTTPSEPPHPSAPGSAIAWVRRHPVVAAAAAAVVLVAGVVASRYFVARDNAKTAEEALTPKEYDLRMMSITVSSRPGSHSDRSCSRTVPTAPACRTTPAG